MIIFALSDTHNASVNVLKHVLAQAKARKAELIVHCGDILPEHISADLFLGLPVVCALTKADVAEDGTPKEGFRIAPSNWTLTRPGARIYQLSKHERLYVGHNMSFEFLAGSEERLRQRIQEIRNADDCVRWVFSGHTHHQIYQQGHVVNFINPGAVSFSFDGYEYAVIDTSNGEVVFSRVPEVGPVKSAFSVGIISDSLNVSQINPMFWQKLVGELKKRDVSRVIHCGNIDLQDVGRPEFEGIEVYFNLRRGQVYSRGVPGNWKMISQEEPVVTIEGAQFYIQLDLGIDLLDKSEMAMKKVGLGIRRKYPEATFILCGMTHDAFYEEGEEIRIINPGDVVKDRNFAVICLPRTEITFGHVPVDPLPEIA